MSKPRVSLAKLKSFLSPLLLTSLGVVSVVSFFPWKYSHNLNLYSARLNVFKSSEERLPSQDLKAQYAPTSPSGYTWGVTPRTPRVQTVPSPNPNYNQQPIQPTQPTTGNTNLGGMPTNQQTPAQGGLNYGTTNTTNIPQQTPAQGGLNYGTGGAGTTTMPQQTTPMSPTQSNYP